MTTGVKKETTLVLGQPRVLLLRDIDEVEEKEVKRKAEETMEGGAGGSLPFFLTLRAEAN